MMKKHYLLSLVLLMAPAAALAQSEGGPPEVSLDGLELVEKNRRGELYADPGIDWTTYDQLLIDPSTVAFRKNWQRDQNRYNYGKVRDSDVERIKAEMSELFDKTFSKELVGKGGYQLAEQSGSNVMRIAPHIVDLDIYAPDTRTVGIQQSYTETAGRMTLKLYIYDSVTGDLIATASDRQEAPRRGYFQWTSSVSNTAEARRMIERWATRFVERLDDARNGQSGS